MKLVGVDYEDTQHRWNGEDVVIVRSSEFVEACILQSLLLIKLLFLSKVR